MSKRASAWALTTHPIVAFVATADPARARAFYSNTLGLRLTSEDAFALVFDAGGTMLRVAVVPHVQAASYTVLGWIVPDIRLTMAELVARGVEFARFPGMGQDEHGAWKAPSGAIVAWFKDPDGNTLSLTELPAKRRPAKTAARRAPSRRSIRGPKTRREPRACR
jgi:catechol 2,3-dioxygenase-like lactoylglutathione lyase family enzyme